MRHFFNKASARPFLRTFCAETQISPANKGPPKRELLFFHKSPATHQRLRSPRSAKAHSAMSPKQRVVT